MLHQHFVFHPKMLAVVCTSCKKSSRKSSSFLLKRNGVSELNEQGLYIAIEAKSSRISFSLGPKCPSPSAVLPYAALCCPACWVEVCRPKFSCKPWAGDNSKRCRSVVVCFDICLEYSKMIMKWLVETTSLD